MNRRIGAAVEKAMEERKAVLINQPGQEAYCAICLGDEEECKYKAEVIAPIIAEGDPIGAVIIISKEENVKFTDLEMKLAETAASLLAKQMEQ